MDEMISLKEFQRRWTILLQQQQQQQDHNNTHPDKHAATAAAAAANNDDDGDDLFDCSSLYIPPRIQQLDALVDDYVDQWKQLDERKIPADYVNQTKEPGTSCSTNSSRSSSKPAWYDKHLRLPRNFDFASKHSAPPPDNYDDDDNDDDGDRIVSLQDPTQTLSYHAALWELFHTIPLASQIETETMSGHPLNHTQTLYHKMLPVSGHAKLDEEAIQALTRIRMGDRHGLLPPPPPPPPPTTTTTTTTSLSQQQQSQQFVATLQLECWRNLPSRCRGRGSLPDPDRMVLEFLGTQTLLDVHQIIVELAQDDLWWRQQQQEEQNEGNVSTNETGNDNNCTCTGNDNTETTHSFCPDSSGFFFIEGVFYTTTTGNMTDYVTNIHDWLQKDCSQDMKENVATRWAQLGLTYNDDYDDDNDNTVVLPLPPPPPHIRDMASTRLEDLELRLAVRYMHIHHGNVECSIYIIDRKMTPHAAASTKNNYPLIHDIWTPAAHPGECEACKVRMATIVTSNTCPITMGHRLLCQTCAEQLQLYQKYPTHVEEFSIWKG